MDAEDVAAYRAMTPPEKLTRVLKFTERIRQFKIESVRVHHPGWSEEKVMDDVLGPQRNESGRALRLMATRVKPQHHPIQAGVETALANCGSITIS